MRTTRWVISIVLTMATVACGHDAEPAHPPPPQAPPQPPPNQPMTPPPATPPSTKAVVAHPTMFGDVTIDDGAVSIMDGGIHGVQGHTIVIDRAGAATWERRLDGMQPNGKPGKGTFTPTADELAKVRAAANALWDQAASGHASFNAPIENGPPRWVWAIVIRRGDEVRYVDGGNLTSPTGAPAEAKPILEWLRTRVDALAL